jgi:hypothetical protein
MGKGRFIATASGNMPVAFLNWYAEEEFEKKGISAIKRKGVSIESSKGGYFSYYCTPCKKVFAEFPTK